MRKRILIVDYTTHHPEVVAAIAESFAEHIVKIAITSSFREKFAKDFEFGNGNMIVKPKKMRISAWLARIAPVIAEQDMVVFSTAIRSLLLLRTLQLKSAAKKIVFVHNSHYFAEKCRLTFSEYRKSSNASDSWLTTALRYLPLKMDYLKRNAKHFVHGTGFHKIADLVDLFCFGNENLAEYFSELTHCKDVISLPVGAGLINFPRPIYEGVLRVAIIGTVALQRRDYLGVIHALDAAHLKGPVELHILGSCPDSIFASKLVDRIKKITNPNLTIIFDADRGFLPTEKLSEEIKKIHILLSPIETTFIFQFFQEKYGLTKISGAEADCLKFNRPILLPAEYRFGARISALAVHYNGPAGLAEKIVELQSANNLAALYARSAQLSLTDADKKIATTLLRKIELI